MTNLEIIISILVISFCISIIVCTIYKHRLEKEMQARIEMEQNYRHQLEDFYAELRQEYMHHYYKHH